MIIDLDSTIAGVPARQLRAAFGTLSWQDSYTDNCFSKAALLGLEQAKICMPILIEEGFIEQATAHQPTWRNTIKGNALAMAKGGKGVKRATADKHFAAFKQRVNEINSSEEYLYQVSKVAVFGSYLSEAEYVGDIDMFVWLERKYQCRETFSIIREKRTEEFIQNGRRFKDYGEQLHWPELDVRKYLKNGSRVISIQPFNEGFEHFKCEIVFDITEKSAKNGLQSG